MNIKMIATDLDGTLLRQDKTISNYTESIFRRCQDKDIKIVFATGRPIRTVELFNLKIDKDAGIYHNGAVITIQDRTHRLIGIEPEMTKKLLFDIAERFSEMRISVEIDDVQYANFDVGTVWPNTSAIITDFTNLPTVPAEKLIFVTSDNYEVSTIRKMLPVDLYCTISENYMLMAMNVNARKSSAIKQVAEYFALSLQEIVAFGDDYNDVEMLRECNIGVAVANAIEEAKAAADDICDTNENDGVAKWMEENLL